MGRLCLFLIFLSGLAWGDDSSRQPAEPMPKASQSLLLDVTDSNGRLVAVGERGHVLLSDDGENWRQAARVPTRSTLTAVAAFGPDLWAVGHDSVIIASGDRGENWTLQHASEDISDPELTRPLLDVFFIDESRGFALGAYALFLGTSDGGATWNALTLTPDGDAVEGEDALEDDSYGADNEGADDDFEYQTYDDFTDDFVDYHLNAMARLGDGTLYIAAERGNGFVSRDDGRSWQGVQLPYDGSMFGVLPTADGSLVTFGMRGNVLESADGGETWNQAQTPTLNSLTGAAVAADGSLVIVGANGETLVRRSGAQAFVSHPHPEGGDLAAVVALGDALVVVGEDGVAVHRVEAGGDQ